MPAPETSWTTPSPHFCIYPINMYQHGVTKFAFIYCEPPLARWFRPNILLWEHSKLCCILHLSLSYPAYPCLSCFQPQAD